MENASETSYRFLDAMLLRFVARHLKAIEWDFQCQVSDYALQGLSGRKFRFYDVTRRVRSPQLGSNVRVLVANKHLNRQ